MEVRTVLPGAEEVPLVVPGTTEVAAVSSGVVSALKGATREGI